MWVELGLAKLEEKGVGSNEVRGAIEIALSDTRGVMVVSRVRLIPRGRHAY